MFAMMSMMRTDCAVYPAETQKLAAIPCTCPSVGSRNSATTMSGSATR